MFDPVTSSLYVGDCLDVIERYPNVISGSHLLITSPPYNFGREYDSIEDNIDNDNYFSTLEKIFSSIYRLANDSFRMVIVVKDNYAKMQFTALDLYSTLKGLNWKPYAYFVLKSGHFSRQTSWGSWLSPSAPRIRCQHELALVFYKKTYKRDNKTQEISKQDFIDFTKSVYYDDDLFVSDVDKRLHPAQFSPNLVKRFVKLFSFKGDTVIDIFNGMGNTGLASLYCGRNYIGIDISKNYILASKKFFLKNGFKNISIKLT